LETGVVCTTDQLGLVDGVQQYRFSDTQFWL